MRTARLLRAGLSGAAALTLSLALPVSAGADDAYRFWGYYHWADPAWEFAQAGPAEHVPAEGDVEGWRYAVAGSDPRLPRADGDFELICGGADAGDGEKRVAVVLDFGTTEDSPDGSAPPAARGACAVVPEGANGAEVLAAVAEVRLDEAGLTCGVAGYPASGCGGPVDDPAPSGDEEPVDLAVDEAAGADDGVPVGLLVGAGAVVVIGGAAAVVARRSRAA